MDQFQLDRQAGLGSTDSAAILGRSPWAGPFSVYQDKIGETPEREPSLPMWLGLALEHTIAQLFTARTGKKLRRSNVVHVHPQFDFVRCHIDYRVIGEPAVVELKTAHSTDGWGEDGGDRIPLHYWIQVQHQMLVLGQSYAYVAALFGHYDFRTYTIQRDEEFTDGLLEALVEFWRTHVEPRVPPELDGSDAARSAVRRRWPKDSEPAIPATPEQAEKVEQMIQIKSEKAALELREEALKTILMDQIGSHAGLVGGGWRVSFKKGQPSHETDWKLVSKEVQPFVPEGDWLASVANHTEEKEGTRPFVLRVDKERTSDGTTTASTTSQAA